jgi:putative PIG3 family NAD(P)H quinone oxidoreductase
MRFVEHDAKGGPASMMRLSEMDVPKPGAGEVLIKVAYSGVNRPDVLQRSGNYNPPPGASPVLGLELSGTVHELGAGVTQWKVGDQVCALTPGGSYSEYCVAPAGHCLPIPKGMTMLEAAAIPENYFTVWTNVFERVKLQAGETILIHGGSSGIGLTAIQLAKQFGATVYTTVGNAEKAKFCVEKGADVAINYREQDFVEEVKKLTKDQGVNVILDMVGGEYIAKNVGLLALEGRLAQIAFLEGGKTAFDFTPVMIKRLVLTGSTLRPRTVEQKNGIANALKEKVLPLMEAGKCRPVIHQTFDLADVVKAHELMESSKHIGKIMLKVFG